MNLTRKKKDVPTIVIHIGVLVIMILIVEVIRRTLIHLNIYGIRFMEMIVASQITLGFGL